MNMANDSASTSKYYHFVSVYFGSMGTGSVEADGKQTSIDEFLARHGGGKLIRMSDEKFSGVYTALFETNEP